jgi:hypothetical protein
MIESAVRQTHPCAKEWDGGNPNKYDIIHTLLGFTLSSEFLVQSKGTNVEERADAKRAKSLRQREARK